MHFGAQAEGLNHVAVLFIFERAGGVDDPAAGLHEAARLIEDFALAGGENIGVAGLQSPLDLGIAAQGAGAGAGGVDQNAVEFLGEWQGLGGVEHYAQGRIGDFLKALQITVAGDDARTCFEGLGGLISRGGAEVENRHSRLNGEQRDDGLGADVLLTAGFGVDGGLRLEEGGAGDFFCEFGAELLIPAGEHPGRQAQLGGAVGEFDGVAVHFTEHRVDESRSRLLTTGFHQLDAFHNGGVRRDTVQITELIDAHADGDADFEVEFRLGAAGKVAGQKIELRLITEHSHDDGFGESGVTRVESFLFMTLEVRGVADVVYFFQDSE